MARPPRRGSAAEGGPVGSEGLLKTAGARTLRIRLGLMTLPP